MSHKDGDQTTMEVGMATNSPWGGGPRRAASGSASGSGGRLFSRFISIIVETMKYNTEVPGMCTGHP